MTLAIIGAGPAGMMAALQAKKAAPARPVTLFDANPNVGRKLLVTGSGRCNLTNASAAAERYTCADPHFMRVLLARFGRAELLAALEEIGVLTFATHDGWYYPLSESAATVVDAFAAALHLQAVDLQLNTRIQEIRTVHGGFQLFAAGSPRPYFFQQLIVAGGGKAYPTLGSQGNLFPSLARLGHTIQPLRPALAPVLADLQRLQRLQGVRLDVKARLYENNNLLTETVGNLIFTQWGFNGPAVMDLSHQISARPNAGLRLELNLLPNSEAALRALVERSRKQKLPLRVLLGAALPPKVPPVILEMAGLHSEVWVSELSQSALDQVFHLLTRLGVAVKGTRDFEYCHISAGGVPVTEVDAETMASQVQPGLYLVGETLDVGELEKIAHEQTRIFAQQLTELGLPVGALMTKRLLLG